MSSLQQAARERLPRWSGRRLAELAAGRPAGQDAAVVAALRPERDTFTLSEPPGPEAEARYQDCLKRLETPPQLIVNLPEASLVRQGQQPNCVLTSTAIALAHQRPYDILRMFEETGEGYQLNLPDQAPRRGPLPGDWDLATESCAYGNGRWMTVLSQELGTVGRVWRPRAIAALTGHGSDTDILKLQFASTTRHKLSRALGDQAVVLAGRSQLAATVPGLRKEHAYAVLDFEPQTEKVSLQDPAGEEPLGSDGRPRDGQADGRFAVSLSEFRSWFDTVTYEQRQGQRSSKCQGRGKAHEHWS